LRPAGSGDRTGVTRINIAYWSLMSVLGALALFLVAAAARVLRWRLGGAETQAPGG
jgi:hypothetical protein